MTIDQKLQKAHNFLLKNPKELWRYVSQDATGLLSGGLLPLLAAHIYSLDKQNHKKELNELWKILNTENLISFHKIDFREIAKAFLGEGFKHNDLSFVRQFYLFVDEHTLHPVKKVRTDLDNVLIGFCVSYVGQKNKDAGACLLELLRENILNKDGAKIIVNLCLEKDAFLFLSSFLKHELFVQEKLDDLIDVKALLYKENKKSEGAVSYILGEEFKGTKIRDRLQMCFAELFSGGSLDVYLKTDSNLTSNKTSWVVEALEKLDNKYLFQSFIKTPKVLDFFMGRQDITKQMEFALYLEENHSDFLQEMPNLLACFIRGNISTTHHLSQRQRKI